MEPTLSDVLARLRQLEDKEAVRDTWLDYCQRLDAEDWPALADVYAPDGELEMVGLATLMPEIDGVYRGREDIIERFYKPAIETGANIPKGLFSTGHLSTNMQIGLNGDEATTLAYFFEILANDLVLISTYQHRMRRDPDRWRFRFLRISVRYYGHIAVTGVGGQSLQEILAKPV